MFEVVRACSAPRKFWLIVLLHAVLFSIDVHVDAMLSFISLEFIICHGGTLSLTLHICLLGLEATTFYLVCCHHYNNKWFVDTVWYIYTYIIDLNPFIPLQLKINAIVVHVYTETQVTTCTCIWSYQMCPIRTACFNSLHVSSALVLYHFITIVILNFKTWIVSCCTLYLFCSCVIDSFSLNFVTGMSGSWGNQHSCQTHLPVWRGP